jgi:hypothetical protein
MNAFTHPTARTNLLRPRLTAGDHGACRTDMGARRIQRATGPAPAGTDRWLALARGRDGRSRWASGRVQSHATAVLAAIAARAVAGLPPGVHHLHQVLTLADVPAGRGIHLQDGVRW